MINGQERIVSTLQESPDELRKGTAADNHMIGSLPPLRHQLLGPTPLAPTTFSLGPKLSSMTLDHKPGIDTTKAKSA